MMTHRILRISPRKFSQMSSQHFFRKFSTHLVKQADGIHTSELSNGMKVLTLSSKQQQAAVGVFVNSGSRFEEAHNFGASFFLKHMGFKSTPIRSSLRLIREIELLGAQYSIGTGREHISYTSELISDRVSDIVPILADVSNPFVTSFEVKEELESISREIQEIESDPHSLSEEIVHQEAFRNMGLGNSLHTPFYNLHHLTDSVLNGFILNSYSPKSTVLIGTGGVDHSQLVSLAEKNFIEISKSRSSLSKQVQSVPSVYVGGDVRLPNNGPTYLTLAFPGASLNSKEQFVYGVLQYILGNSKSFSTEGPGRGLSGRLNTNLVSQHPWIHSASSFSLNYSDSGLFGVTFCAERGNAQELAHLVVAEINKLGRIEEIELQRGKSLFKSSILFNTETTGDLMQFIGRRALQGELRTPQEVAKIIDSVTLDQVQSIVSQILKSKPTVVALGDVANLPVISL